jgi:hypothetical protein
VDDAELFNRIKLCILYIIITNTLQGLTMNKLRLGVSLGFVIGALCGVIISMVTRKLSMWLSTEVGGGIAVGAVIGGMLEYRKSDSIKNAM